MFLAMTILGVVPDAWIYVSWSATFLCGICLTLGLENVRQKYASQRKLAETVQERAEDLIRVEDSMLSLKGALDACTRRIDDGDTEMRDLLERKHQLDLKIEQRFDAMKDWIRENAVSKDDMHELREDVSSLRTSVEQLRGRKTP